MRVRTREQCFIIQTGSECKHVQTNLMEVKFKSLPLTTQVVLTHRQNIIHRSPRCARFVDLCANSCAP